MRIAQNLKLDKRSKSRIEAVVHNTRVYLTYNNLHLNLSTIEARRLFEVLDKACNIQASKRLERAYKKQEMK